MEKNLKEILIMFKTEQDYAERKNQIIFAVFAIIMSIFAASINKLLTIQLEILITIFLFIFLTTLSSFLPQGKIIKTFSWIINLLIKTKSKKYKRKDDNYWNFLNWKNFEEKELEDAMNFFNIPIDKINKNICDQILITSRLIYLKYVYFNYLCILLTIGIFISTLVLIFIK